MDVAALDIGGTHVARALVDPERWTVRAGTVGRHDLRSDGTAGEILGSIIACGLELDLPPDARCGIAIPAPFDMVRGVGLFTSGKFDALNGVDVRTALASGLGLDGSRLVFTHDSHAFLRGEWVAGAAAGHDRAAGITLGTGVGSAFLAGGEIIASGNQVPPEGRVDLLQIDGRPLEDTMSRRALLAAYGARGPGGRPQKVEAGVDVRAVFDRARQGEAAARQVIDTALDALGRALAPWLERFGATILVVGGAMSGSWDLVEPPLRAGLGDVVAVELAHEPSLSLLVGAAWQCAHDR